ERTAALDGEGQRGGGTAVEGRAADVDELETLRAGPTDHQRAEVQARRAERQLRWGRGWEQAIDVEPAGKRGQIDLAVRHGWRAKFGVIADGIPRADLLRVPKFAADVLGVLGVQDARQHALVGIASELMVRPHNPAARV